MIQGFLLGLVYDKVSFDVIQLQRMQLESTGVNSQTASTFTQFNLYETRGWFPARI